MKDRTAIDAALTAHADHLATAARKNGIGPERFAIMEAARHAADALYEVAELIAQGRPVGHPEVRLWMRAAGARMGEAGRAVEAIPD